MAAKKSRGWRSGKREGRPRMVQMTRHLVVTKGKETEPRYFEGVRAALGTANERKVAVVVKGTGNIRLTCSTSPLNIVAMRLRHLITCGSSSIRTTSLHAILMRWSVNVQSSPMGQGRFMRCGRTPALNCGSFCTFAIRLLP